MHEHKFYFVESGPDCEYCQYHASIALMKCRCGKEIGPTTIENRINASEKLDKGRVSDIVTCLDVLLKLNNGGYDPNLYMALSVHSAALEKE